MKSTKTVSTHLWQHIVSDNKAGFLLSDCFLLTRSSLQTGSEWQGGTELPQSTGSHGSKQTGMANTSTNTTASLHWNVATPAQKLARARKQWIHNEQTDEVNDTIENHAAEWDDTHVKNTEAKRWCESVWRAGSRWDSFVKRSGKNVEEHTCTTIIQLKLNKPQHSNIMNPNGNSITL